METTTKAQQFAAWIKDLPKNEGDLPAAINYLQTEGGVVQFRVLPYGVVCEKVEGKALVPPEGPAIPPVPPMRVYLTTPKIPWGEYAKIVAFFRAVYEKEKAEAIIRVFYDPNAEEGKRWILHCPDQKVSGAHVDHNDDFDLEGKLRHVADIHSHNTMPAFFSGTDDADEKKATRLYGVVGKIDQAIPASNWRAWTGKKFEELKLADIVELPTEENMAITVSIPLHKMVQEKDGKKDFVVTSESVATALFPPDFPAEWMDHINPKGWVTKGRKTGGVITYSPGGDRSEWRYDYGKRCWVDEKGNEADFAGHGGWQHGRGAPRQGMMGFGPSMQEDEGREERAGGKGNGAGRRARGSTAAGNTSLTLTDQIEQRARLTYDKVGPAAEMLGAALWAALDDNALVYLVNLNRDDVYRVFPDQKIQLRGLSVNDLQQMKARKMQVAGTSTKIFACPTLPMEVVEETVAAFQRLRVMKGEDGKGGVS